MEETLQQIGLTPEETEIYLFLINNGTKSAAQIGKGTKVKRTYVYRIVQNLIDKGLATQGKQGRTTVFSPNSPDHLLTLASRKKQQAEQAEAAVERVLGTLKKQFTTVDSKPLVTTYQGIEGIRKIYKDILEEGKDILLFRSNYDDKRDDIDEIVMNQLKLQVEKKIHVRTITPLEPTTKETYLYRDKERLVTRHIVTNRKYELPSQIIVYGDKVAIISLKSEIIATLIDNKDIAETFTQLFELLWKVSEVEHNRITSKWTTTNQE